MPELVGDIKKIDQDKIREGREVLLKYLAEVDQAADDKPKSQKQKALDSLASKPAEVKQPLAPAVPARPVEAKIDFVKDFKSAESKLSKPITDIIHEVMAKSAAEFSAKPAEAPPAAPVVQSAPEEVKTENKAVEVKAVREIPQIASPVMTKKTTPPTAVMKKMSKKKRIRFLRAKKEGEGKKAEAAVDFLGRIIFKFLSAVTAVAIVYFVFCLSLYTFGFDNGLSRLITKIFPVPAFITQYGAVNYYDYLDAKTAAVKEQKNSNRALGEVLASIAAREKLISRLILADLAKNYGLSAAALDSSSSESALENKLALLIVADPTINKDNLKKLRTIKNVLRSGADFTQTAGSFGLQAKIEYFNSDSIKEKFGSRALELAASSTIETTSVRQGYYVFQFYNRQDGLTGFKYIFVPAKTLEMIIADKFSAADLIILAN